MNSYIDTAISGATGSRSVVGDIATLAFGLDANVRKTQLIEHSRDAFGAFPCKIVVVVLGTDIVGTPNEKQ